MTEALPMKKILLYGGLMAVLLAANFLMWVPVQKSPDAVRTEQARVAAWDLADLSLRRELDMRQDQPARDLFRIDEDEPDEPVVQPVQPQTATRLDANAILLENVRKRFKDITILGILGAQTGPVAVVEYEGSVSTVGRGDLVLPGFQVTDISLEHITIAHEATNLKNTYRVGEPAGK